MEINVRAKPNLAENMSFLGSDVPIFHAAAKASCNFSTNPMILSKKKRKRDERNVPIGAKGCGRVVIVTNKDIACRIWGKPLSCGDSKRSIEHSTSPGQSI